MAEWLYTSGGDTDSKERSILIPDFKSSYLYHVCFNLQAIFFQCSGYISMGFNTDNELESLTKYLQIKQSYAAYYIFKDS